MLTGPKIGTRYSKLPSSCVSAPMGWKPRDGLTITFAPSGPVNVPSCRAMACKFALSTGTGVPLGFAASTTFCEVTNWSIGTMGLIERTL